MLPVGYFPCTQDAPDGKNIARVIDELVDQVELCEQVGFDGFFFTDTTANTTPLTMCVSRLPPTSSRGRRSGSRAGYSPG